MGLEVNFSLIEMDSFEEKKREFMQPILFEAGAGLLDCQTFEYGIALLLYHFARIGSEGLDAEEIELILTNTNKKTAGQLISLMRRHLSISEGIDQAVSEALDARNELVHRVLIEKIESVIDGDGRDALVKSVRQLRSRVRKANLLLQPFIVGLNDALDGISHSQLEAQVRSRLGFATGND